MRPWILAAALAVLALGGCKRNAGWKAAGEYPERAADPNTTFPHSSHASLDCTDCHGEVAKSDRLGAVKLPGADKCAECHEKDAMHAAPAARPPVEYAYRFSHAQHMPQLQGKKDACATCHKVLPEPGEKRRLTPAMATCTACHHHEVEVAEARCRPCHVSLKQYGLKPLEQFTEFSHAGNFVREHGRLAANSAETCAQCHDQTYCAACHATTTRPLKPSLLWPENVTSDFIHRGDYITRHHIEAEREPASCRKCHGSNFCASCHEAQRLTSTSLNPRNPHPEPQVWNRRGSGNFHGDAARANIVSCAGCHDQGAASVCVQCHAVGGPGGNPHPAGFISKHRTDDKRKNVACRACHTR